MLIRTRAALAATVLASLTCASAAYAAPTSLDHGFSGDGVLRLHSNAHSEILADQVVLPNGEIELVTLTQSEPAIELRRLHPDGRPDRSFGDHGVATTALFSSYEDVHLAYDARTGKSYVSTFIDNGTAPTTIWRFKQNGDLDTSFGHGQGHVDRNDFLAEDMVAVKGGGLRVAGEDFADQKPKVWGLQNGGGNADFGDAGDAVLSTDGNDGVGSIAALPNGELVVAGSHYDPTASTLTVYRLKAGGLLDHHFGHAGKATIDPSRTGVTTSTVWKPQVLVRPDGRTAYVAGLNQSDHGTFETTLLTAGLTAKGRPDRVFGTRVSTGLFTSWSEAVLARDGKVLLTAKDERTPTAVGAVVRFTDRGRLDHSWSHDGVLALPGGDPDNLGLISLTPQGRILVGRTLTAGSSYDAQLRAYRGTPTPTCHGHLATQFGTAKADTITGTPGRDVLVGLGGNDRIKGLAGNDVLCGNAGRDVLVGGPGKDVLVGGPGRDTLHE